MTTVSVTGTYLVAPSENLTFTGSNGGLGAYDLSGAADFTDEGQIGVQSAVADETLVGIHTESGTTVSVHIAAGASFALEAVRN